MNPVSRVITTDPQVIPLNTYGRVGAGIYVSGAAVVSALADEKNVASVIAVVTGGVLSYPADGLLVASGIGQTVIVSQYGD